MRCVAMGEKEKQMLVADFLKKWKPEGEVVIAAKHMKVTLSD